MKRQERIGFITILLVVSLSLMVPSAVAEQDELFGEFDNPEQIIQSKKFDNYNQSPKLKNLVEKGKLPPVKNRLPDKPMVWTKDFMVDGQGTYGGIWRDNWGVTPEGWHFAAGQIQGYFGITQIIQETLVDTGKMWMLKNPEPLPSLAKEWEWSEDGRALTVHLREGIKWSDGVPFTAEDVIFTYRDNILDKNVPSPASPDNWTYGGEVAEIEKVDKYTVKWHLGTSLPVDVFYNMNYLDFSVAPAHVYKQYHPEYNPDVAYSDYNEATPPQSLPAVVLGPWVPVKYEAGQQLLLVRNPYFWQVDEEGNQLPYLDVIRFSRIQSGPQWTRNLIAGKVDHANISRPELFTVAKREAQKEGSHFEVEGDTPTILINTLINQSLYASVDSDRDKALRNLFREEKFRKAISYALDREGIASAAAPGDFAEPVYGLYTTSSPMHQEDKVVKYKHNQEKSKALLSELGFKDTDGDGIRNWPEDTLLSGQNLKIEAIVDSGETLVKSTGETFIPLLRDVGIDLNLKTLTTKVFEDRRDAGDFDFALHRHLQNSTPSLHPGNIGPVSKFTPDWHNAGPDGNRALQDFEKEIKSLIEKTSTMKSAERKAEVYRKILYLSSKNAYTVPIIQTKEALGIAERFQNIPADAPVRFYGYFWTGSPIQTSWTPKQKQIDSKVQVEELIPLPSTYKAQDWYPES